MENTIQDKIIEVNIREEMQKSYIDYAMSVIVSRALPDVRDGLKPVHRRILYAMNELGFTSDKPHRKSARIVGDVLGKYHPHGDSSVYNAMVRMAQDFSIRYLLIDGHGNFGSVDGDSAAAMRYTEARMSKLSDELLKDIEKNTIDYSPNFDDSLQEPKVLPSRYPNLLVNGSNGIAVGMATSIPPHNLGEIIDATVMLIDDRDTDIEDLISIVKAPDFPTGAKILGNSDVTNAYRTGRGRVVTRSTTHFEEISRGKTAIIVTEIPYLVNKSKLLEDIANLVKDKKIDGITDLRDESNREGMRIVIELRRDVNPNVMLNKLYKATQLQDTFSVILLALVDNQPKVLNLKEILGHYIDHQREVETRRINFDLEKAKQRAHILEGLRIALDNIDRIVELIRASKDGNEAKANLIEEFALSEEQAKAILDMRLQRLTGLERDKIEEEYKELLSKIEYFLSVLADDKLLFGIIKEDLERIKKQYADERRSEIIFDENDINIEDLIEEKEMTITLTQKGYIKRVPQDQYTVQNRGGRGKNAVSTREEDYVVDLFNTSTHDNLLFFTNYGKMYKLKAYMIPETSRIARGTSIINLIQIDQDEVVTAVIAVKKMDDRNLMMVTKSGTVKRMNLKDLDSSRKTGIIAIGLKEGDELNSVRITSGNDDVIMITRNGMSIRFNENDVRVMGRTAFGVKGMDIDDDDSIVNMEVVDKDGTLLTVTENGFGKKTQVDDYRVQSRGGKGIINYKINSKTGKIVGSKFVREGEEVLLINNQGVVIRLRVSDISTIGRNTSGVILMKSGEDKIASISKIIEIEE